MDTVSKPFSFHWGYGILTVIILFFAMISYMVYVASQQSNEMMDDHYYQKELNFQHTVSAARNLNAMQSTTLISQNADAVRIDFPVHTFEKTEGGEIDFLRGDAMRRDLHYVLVAGSNPSFTIPKSALIKGLYKVRISWSNAGVPYYYEENLFIQ